MTAADLTWRSLGTGEPGDQEADSALVGRGYWAIGPNGTGLWSVELVEQDLAGAEILTGGIRLLDCAIEAAAKAAAQGYEQSHERGIPGVEPPPKAMI